MKSVLLNVSFNFLDIKSEYIYYVPIGESLVYLFSRIIL